MILAFDEAWSDWLDSTLEGNGTKPDIENALSLGFSLGLTVDNLKTVALKFYENYDLIERASFEDSDIPSTSIINVVANAADELGRLCAYSNLQEDDILFNHVQENSRPSAGYRE